MCISKKIGKRIKEIRLERKMSREQVARRLKIVQQTIEKYEKGEIEISVVQLIKISNILNVGISYFLQDYELHKHYIQKQIELTESI